MQFYDPSFVYSGRGNNVLEVEASNQDTTDSEYQYFGYIAPRTGAWIIQRFQSIGSTIQYRYALGRTRADYDAHWNEATGRFVAGDPALEFFTIDLAVPK